MKPQSFINLEDRQYELMPEFEFENKDDAYYILMQFRKSPKLHDEYFFRIKTAFKKFYIYKSKKL